MAIDAQELADGVGAGERRALAQAITLVESTRPEDRERATALLTELAGATEHTHDVRRVGISGAPGVGKSTFLDAYGMHLIQHGHRVAVLAVDPSSGRTGGSILGDKTRMPRLATSDDAYVRPSPAGRTLGGVARRTRETLTLCEAAGYDHVLVETVGVGQSETAVAEMVDTFVLLAAPGGGDDLQGIKRGIVELADLVVVTKADGGLLPDARRAAADHRAAVGLLRPALAGWKPPVLLTSAVEGEGITEVAEAVEAHRDALQDAGALGDLRAGQATAWLWREVGDRLLDALRRHPGARQEVTELEDEVATGALPPSVAADRLLAAFLERDG